jgi:hypothetical protein
MHWAAEGGLSVPINQQMHPDRWFVIGVAFYFVAVVAFFAWAPWTTAITVEQASEQYPGQVDPNWRAVTVNHGRPSEWSLGTVAENPAGFAGCSAVLGLGAAGFVYSMYRGASRARWIRRRTHNDEP